MALVVWAAVIEAVRPRRGWPVFALLGLAGLLRPEAWILSGLYFLWMCRGATWGERARYAALTAIAPLAWAAVDFAVTGDPLFSLHYTSSSAEDLGRQRTLGEIPSALPSSSRASSSCRSCSARSGGSGSRCSPRRGGQ